MAELTKEEKLKILEKLPIELQEIYFEDSGVISLYLGKKHNLDDNKVSLLSKLLGDVILGILPAENLASDINAQITNDSQIAAKLAQELNDLITNAKFGPAAPAMPSEVPPEVPKIVDLRRTPPSMPPPPASTAPPISTPRPAAPEVIDLRNRPKAGPPWAETPPPLTRVPIAAAPIPPRPLTFTKPITPPTPLIEASPHENLSRFNLDRIKTSADTYREKIDVLDLRKNKGEF